MLNSDLGSWGECLANACSAKNRRSRFLAASAVNKIGALGLFQVMPDTLAAVAPRCIGKVPTQVECLADQECSKRSPNVIGVES